MNAKLAKLAEHQTKEIAIDHVKLNSGHGLLPSDCCKCKGPLDFTRKNKETILKCRNCGLEVSLD